MGYRRPVDDRTPAIRLEAWAQEDLSLLRATNSPEMTDHLGGPETDSQVLDRHRRYLDLTDPRAGQMLAVVMPDGRRAGVIGYWERPWRDGLTYETGWSVLPVFQGQGIATAAARAVAVLASAQRRHGYLHAFPAVDHPASNAICRKAGFALVGEADIEYPPGSVMRCHEWRLAL
jgi:RimJ/RimL family protein N-acetyltransferase